MKKVLFGIMALSVAAFAANPGGTADGGTVSSTNPETASVPVKVIAEIITAPTGLTITDEAGTVLDELVIDHGRIVANNAGDDSVAFKIFKVKRFEQNNTAVAIGGAGDNLKVAIGDATGTKLTAGTKATLKLNGDAKATSTLASTLTVTGGNSPVDGQEYNHILAATDLEHVGRVTSRIARDEFYDANLKPGVHHNSRQNTLTVVYTPTKLTPQE